MYRQPVLILFIVGLLARAASPHPGFTDMFSWEGKQAPEESEQEDSRTCSCQGPQCQCCIDFKVSFVDLGGPGCVQMKYVSEDEGLMVNVTYGDSQLHNEKINGTETAVTCMDLLSDLAQICARFSDLGKTSNGPRGCVALEPMLLGEAQDSYKMGCFEMGPTGMSFRAPTTTPTVSSPSSTENPGETEVSEEALIAAVNESAEEGIAWFSSLLGLSFGSSRNDTHSPATTAQPPPDS